MMLFMLLSMVSSIGLTASAAPSDSSSDGRTAFQTAEECYALDTNKNLHLSATELGAVADAGEREALRDYCEALPSKVLSVEDNNTGPGQGENGICHANEGVKQYTYIAPSDSSYETHLKHVGAGGSDRFATKAEFEAGECFPDQVTVPVAPTVTAGVCVEGVYTAPIITPATTAGITYAVNLNAETGAYTVVATLASGYIFGDLTGTGFVASEDGRTATFTGTVDLGECEAETGQIAVFKTLCETIGQQDTCNGRDDLLAGYMVDFNIYAGTGTGSEPVETVTVTLGENAGGGGNTGAGSQGRIVSSELPLGTYTVCEVEVAYNSEGDEVFLEAFPRPTASQGGSTGGTNQEQFGEDCILVELTPGTAELKFLDLVVDAPEEEEVVINIYKEVCAHLHHPEHHHPEHHADPCVSSDDLDGTEIEFTVTYVIGGVETTEETSLVVQGNEGSAVVTLPLADSYTICEVVPEGVEGVDFAIDVDGAEATEDGCITFSGEAVPDSGVVNVLFWNDLEDKKPEQPEKPEQPGEKPQPQQPGKAVVTTLPSTGSGDEQSNNAVASLALLAGAAAMAGTGLLLRKERPAA